ncbi:MAG: hypothetical protein WC728_05195 [Elusimicrobiota bacterium]
MASFDELGWLRGQAEALGGGMRALQDRISALKAGASGGNPKV